MKLLHFWRRFFLLCCSLSWSPLDPGTLCRTLGHLVRTLGPCGTLWKGKKSILPLLNCSIYGADFLCSAAACLEGGDAIAFTGDVQQGEPGSPRGGVRSNHRRRGEDLRWHPEFQILLKYTFFHVVPFEKPRGPHHVLLGRWSLPHQPQVQEQAWLGMSSITKVILGE